MFLLYVILIIAGLFLIGAEIFLPGGVIGLIGTMSLLAAIVVSFFIFPMDIALLNTLAIIVLSGICIVIWVKFFPRSRLGKSLTLADNGKSFKSASLEFMDLLGKEGVTMSVLRPAGIAKFDGKRVDVVTNGSWIESGKPVKVIQVQGIRILVKEILPPTAAKDLGA